MKTKKHFYRIFLLILLVVSVILTLLLDLIKAPVRSEPMYLYALSLVSIFTFLLFLTICFIKQMISFVPNLLVAIGICGHLMCASLYAYGLIEQSTIYPLEGCIIGIGVIGATLTAEGKLGRVPIKLPLMAFAALCTLLDLIRSFMTAPPAAFVSTVTVLCVLCLLLTLAAIFASAKTASKTELLTPSALCCILAFFTVLSPSEHVFIFSPEYTLALLTILAITFYGFKEVITLERRNAYLTENMQTEIERQTKELQRILTERENVMRFISHDTRKPLVTMRKFITVAREREADVEQIKTIDIIDQKAAQIERNLNEIAKYAKYTYTAEQSRVIPVRDAIESTYVELKPDCDANGIAFEAQYIDAQIYAKPDLLHSVLTNIVINAIEHASCTRIKIWAQKCEDSVCIMITDNGVGIDDDTAQLLFKPYEANPESRTNGLGLYICKTHMDSMNGNIKYTADENGLTFVISVPKA